MWSSKEANPAKDLFPRRWGFGEARHKEVGRTAGGGGGAAPASGENASFGPVLGNYFGGKCKTCVTKCHA